MYGFNLNTTMDNLRRQSYSESLKTTLNCYQLSSADSLSGPSGYPALAAQLWFQENEQSPPAPPPPHIQIPLLMPNDTSTQRSETVLGGERISCFIVGGEKRLCLPQILTTVLRDFSISEINRSCAELHIYCSRCSPDQLEILKVLGILPFNTTQCGLITKTDAERLISSLDVEYHLNAKHNPANPEAKGIPVYHECFGRGDGIFYSDLYVSEDATCIACMDCRVTLSPKRFVSHSHRGLEKRTCHWGFDPENWRNYIQLPNDIEKTKRKELEKQLDALKNKFDSTINDRSNGSPPLKRKRESNYNKDQCKRFKEEKVDDSSYFTLPQAAPVCFGIPFSLPHSAFKPWSPRLPVGLSRIHELQSGQEDTLVKSFASIVPDRRLLPGYVHLTPTATVAAQRAAEWATALREAEAAPNVSLSPTAHKRIPPLIEDTSRLRTCSSDTSPCSHSSRGAVSSRKDAESSTRETGSDMITAHNSRISSRPERRTSRCSSELASKDFLCSHQSRRLDPPVTSSSDSNKPLSKIENDDVTERLREHSSVLCESSSHNKAVVAASAMLELSSTVKNGTEEVTSASQSAPLMLVKNKQKSSSSPQSSFPLITSLDASHQKWSFRDHSYVISSRGSEEVKMIQGMLKQAVIEEEIKEKLLRDIVKMKSRCEEKLDIQSRVQRDLESELERAKSSRDLGLKDADRKRRDLRHEMEVMRTEHQIRMREARASLIDIGRQLTSHQNSPNDHQHRSILQHKILEKLQNEIEEREEAVDQLQKQLFVERERREDAERKVEELSGRSRGRISLLFDNTISSMIRHPSSNSKG